MKLHQLRYFVALCRVRNFTRAAELCHVAQPSLTRAIKDLEHELGGPLFVRGHAQNEPTALGRFVQAHIEDIDARLTQLKTSVTCWRNLRAPLRIGTHCSIGPAALADLLVRFHERHAGVDLEVSQAGASDLEAGVSSNVLDVAVLARHLCTDPRLASTELYREPFVVACSLRHRLAARSTIRLADLDGEVYLDRLACDRRIDIDRELTRRGIELKASFRSDHEEWVLQAVAMGFGVAIVPQSAARPGMATRPLVDPALSRDISLLSARRRHQSPAAAEFLRMAAGYAWANGVH